MNKDQVEMTTEDQATETPVTETPETPDAAGAAIETVDLEEVETGYIDGVLMEFNKSKGLRPRRYGRVQPAEKGAAAATVYGVPEGLKTGVRVGTFARFYVLPDGKGNNFVYCGHDVISAQSRRAGSKKITLQTKADALTQIEARDKAAKVKTPAGAKTDI